MQAFFVLVGSITTMTHLLILTTFPWPEISWPEGKVGGDSLRRCSDAGHMNKISLHHKELFCQSKVSLHRHFYSRALNSDSVRVAHDVHLKRKLNISFLFLDPVRFRSRKQIRWKRAEQQDKASLAAEPWAQTQTEREREPTWTLCLLTEGVLLPAALTCKSVSAVFMTGHLKQREPKQMKDRGLISEECKHHSQRSADWYS